MSVNILPDSRTRIVRGSVPTKRGNMVPISCANCGAPRGYVDEKMCTFAFALCEPCAEQFGDDAHFYKEPDAVFWARCAEAQANEGIEEVEDLAMALSDPSNPLAKLAKEWQDKLRKIA